MTIRRFRGQTARPVTSLGATCLAAVMAGIFAGPALAQQPATAGAPPPQTPPPAANAPAADKYLGLSEIERRVSATGVRVTEIEVKDRIVEVEGRDASNREVELVVDRRSGEILSRKVED
jgi:hypothetical protein